MVPALGAQRLDPRRSDLAGGSLSLRSRGLALLAAIALALLLSLTPAASAPSSTASLGTQLGKGAAQATVHTGTSPGSAVAGSLEAAKVRILGVPVLIVAAPAHQGDGESEATRRARLIEGNLALLYAPGTICNTSEMISEWLIGRNDRIPYDQRACSTESWGIRGDPDEVNVLIRHTPSGPPVLVAALSGRDEPFPLLTVTSEDARLNGVAPDVLAERWRGIVEQRLRQARQSVQGGSILRRLRWVLVAELVILALMVGLLWLWSRSRRSLLRLQVRRTLRPSPRLEWRLHWLILLRRILFMAVLVAVVVMVAVAVMAFPGRLPLGMALLLQPGGVLAKALLFSLLTFAARVLVGFLLRQWVVADGIPEEERERRVQRYHSLQRITNRLIELVALFLFSLWVVLDIPGVRAASAQVLLAGGALLGAMAFVFQGLLRDFVSGLVVLLEDRYAIDDVVEIHGELGAVVDVGVLSTQLRSFDQRVLVIQNSLVESVINHTKIRSGSHFTLLLSHRLRSLEQALAVLRAELEAFHADPHWRPLLLGVPELRGVSRVLQQGIEISVLVLTRPSEQWLAMRELQRRLVEALRREEIPLARTLEGR